MKNLLFVLLLVAALFVAVAVSPVRADHTVVICHYPPGNPDNRQTIEISEAALGAHLTNHELDTVGACAH